MRLLALLLFVGCGRPVDVAEPSASDGTVHLEPPDASEGFQMGIDVVAPAHTEIWKCLVTDLPNPSLAAVQRVVSKQVPGVHHMDVMALGLLPIEIEEGMHDCEALYRDNAEMMEDGIFIYASQLPEEELQLPQGVAATLPPNLRVMIEIHYVNSSSEDVDVWSRVNAYTMPVSDIEESIWGSAVRDDQINIPAGASEHVEWTRCEMNQDIDLLFLSSHTHELATHFEVYLWDGDARGELIYENDDWHAPRLDTFTPQLHIPQGTGFEFHCVYENPGESDVHWGFTAADEMCQIGIVHTPGSFAAACEIVASSDGLMP